MPKNCRCGGKYALAWETTKAFAVKCSGCGKRAVQHKRTTKNREDRLLKSYE